MKKLLLAAVAAALMPVPAMAQDADAYDSEDAAPVAHDGLRIEGRVLFERINDPDEAAGINYELGSGVAFGGEIGYDIAVSDTIAIGPFASYEASSVEECDLGVCVSSDGYFVVGLHAGFASGTDSQFYAKAGYSQQTIAVEGTFNDPVFGQVVLDESETGGGYQFAFGYEKGFGSNAYGRIELGIGENYDLYGFDFKRVSGGVGVGVRF
jgi:outer membrane immunogenic protein